MDIAEQALATYGIRQILAPTGSVAKSVSVCDLNPSLQQSRPVRAAGRTVRRFGEQLRRKIETGS